MQPPAPPQRQARDMGPLAMSLLMGVGTLYIGIALGAGNDDPPRLVAMIALALAVFALALGVIRRPPALLSPGGVGLFLLAASLCATVWSIFWVAGVAISILAAVIALWYVLQQRQNTQTV